MTRDEAISPRSRMSSVKLVRRESGCSTCGGLRRTNGARAMAMDEHAFLDEGGDRAPQGRARHLQHVRQFPLAGQHVRHREAAAGDLALQRLADAFEERHAFGSARPAPLHFRLRPR